MKILADEGVDESIVTVLRSSGFDVEYILEIAPGTSDDIILEKANKDDRVLLTQDKDFGELVFRLGMIHTGVVLLRFHGLPSEVKARFVLEAFEKSDIEFKGAFVVIQPGAIRGKKENGISAHSDFTLFLMNEN